jgi:predicted nucleotidyltransferase
MGVLGLREALASSISVLLPLGQNIDVVSLPMLLVLKALAWVDRRTRERGRDAPDLMLILQNYLDAGQAERLYSVAENLSSTGKFDYESAGAWLAGRDARMLLHRFSADPNHIEQTIISVLTPEIDPGGPLRLIGELKYINFDRALMLLKSFLAGFSGGPCP